MSIYPSVDGHTVVPESGRSLLGTTAQFCSSFYHIEPTPEGDIPERCLSVATGGPPCPRKTVVCVARLQTQPRRSGQDQAVAAPSATDTSAVHGLAASTAALSLSGAARQTAACTAATASSADASAPAASDARWSDLYIARYSNCWRGSSESNVHAEQFLLQDEDLRTAIAALASAATPGTIGGGDGGDSGGDGGGGGRRHRLLLYLTYQPCHHSGGHSRRLLGEHSTSCTLLLCAFVREVLHPAGVDLDLRVAYTYRAHWEEGGYDSKYAPAVLSARRGLALLRREGVALQSLSPADWVCHPLSPPRFTPHAVRPREPCTDVSRTCPLSSR